MNEKPYSQLCVVVGHKDIKNIVKSCKGRALAAKAPLIRYSRWPKMDRPGSRMLIDFAGPLDGFYYIVIIDSFSKWLEVLRCRNSTTEVTINFSHELFARFGVVDCPVFDNGTQFMSGNFKDFCETFQINHITIAPYHPRSNRQAERFVDTLKRALKKARGTPTRKVLQQFIQVYRITPSYNIPSLFRPR